MTKVPLTLSLRALKTKNAGEQKLKDASNQSALKRRVNKAIESEMSLRGDFDNQAKIKKNGKNLRKHTSKKGIVSESKLNRLPLTLSKK